MSLELIVIVLAIVFALLLVKVILFAPRPQRLTGTARVTNGVSNDEHKSRVTYRSRH